MSKRTPQEAPSAGLRAIAGGIWRLGGWAPAAVFALHVILHEVFDAYARIPHLDVPMHVAGGAAIALVAWRSFGWVVTGVFPPMIRLAFVVGLTSFAAVVWELAEFLSDRYLGTRVQTGLEDTLLDMTMGLVGGFGYVALRRLIDGADFENTADRKTALRDST